jgi:ribonucleotide reductase alpha subunit
VRNLNKVIDINYYPTPETEHNNKEHRPIAIGVQGLYNVFMEMRYPFDSPDAKHLNKNIFECIQYYAIMESCDMSIEFGPYNSYTGSPISKGIFQHNMWGIDKDAEENLCLSWDTLRQKVMKHGVRNSLLTALPPTASTSQILGNVESFEVLTSNFYMRRVLSGNYPIINRYLINDLMHLKLWNSSIKKQIITNDGSIQGIKEIPQELKNLYKTTWEVSQKTTISLAADRAPFIDHSQSLNIFIAAPTVAKLSSMHFYGWKSGLKTGMYYLRSLAASSAEKFSVDTQMKDLVCSIDNREACESCSG